MSLSVVKGLVNLDRLVDSVIYKPNLSFYYIKRFSLQMVCVIIRVANVILRIIVS